MATDLWPRVKQSWFPLMFLLLFAWLDWIMHRSILFLLFIGGAAVALVLFRQDIGRVVRARLNVQVHPVASTLLWAAPALLYFLMRGQGTSGAAIPVILAVCGTLVSTAIFGDRIDAVLSGYYKVRDRILPPVVAAVLVLVLPILISFAVIHGSLSDLPAFFGGSTESPLSPSGLWFRFFLGTLLATVLTVLLTRRPAR